MEVIQALVAVFLLAALVQCQTDTQSVMLRQIMALQTAMEEQNRAGTASGLKQIRVIKGGTQNYYFNDHTGKQVAAIHNHANYDRTIGMGEVIVVLNGVEFRTRHNDYKLTMPHITSNPLKDSSEIPFPEVPPSVAAKKSVEEEINEMRLYFRAFKDQNTKLRDYRPYFKPVLCYLEGAWTATSDKIDEPFESDRHSIDATSWQELIDNINFFSYTGGKNPLENLAYLPTKIMEVVDGKPVMAQWNYRIRCAPVSLKEDQGLNLNRFRTIDDIRARVVDSKTLDEYAETRSARFMLGQWSSQAEGRQLDRPIYGDDMLDRLMNQIPGYDNYNQFIPDNAFGPSSKGANGSLLNSAYYHRRYKAQTPDAMGQSLRRRSFADQNVFMAQNTQENIVGARFKGCSKKKEPCYDFRQKWSYAIPLEIIYMTPLLSWNPYHLTHYERGSDRSAVTDGGRNGGLTEDKAYNGTTFQHFFRTPAALFGEDSLETDAADTGKDVVGVLDADGVVQKVQSSGTRIFIPSIRGVGPVRTRYPIAPLTNDGNQIFKDLSALRDIVLRMSSYSDMLQELPPRGNGTVKRPPKTSEELEMDETTQVPPGQHSHSFTLQVEEIETLLKGGRVTTETSEAAGHSHSLVLKLTKNKTKMFYVTCSGQKTCRDGHPKGISSAKNLLLKYKESV